MKSSIIRTLLCSTFAAVVCVAAMGTPALAQDKPTNAAAEKANASLEKLRGEARQISEQLNEIEDKTLKQDKDLQAKRKHLTDHIVKVMKSKGFSPQADQMELVSIRKEIMSGKLKKDEREAKIQEFQAVRNRMFKAQQAAMQDEGLRKESGAFAKATMASMEKADPKTKKLFKRLGEIKAQILAIYKEEQQNKATN